MRISQELSLLVGKHGNTVIEEVHAWVSKV